jgi:hypothetical protein
MSNSVTADEVDLDANVKPTTSRLSVNLPPKMIEELKGVADEEGVTVTEIVRRAILVERFFREHKNAGNEILIHEKGKKDPARILFIW